MPSLPPLPVPPTPPAGRAYVVAQWAQALRNRADSAALQQLPPLINAEAAQVMARLRGGYSLDGRRPAAGHSPGSLLPLPLYFLYYSCVPDVH